MDDQTHELRTRLKHIIDTEGLTTVEPSYLCKASETAIELNKQSVNPLLPDKQNKKVWVFLIVGGVIGIIVASIMFAICRWFASPQTHPSARVSRKATVLEDVEEDDDEDEDDDEIPSPPQIAIVEPPKTIQRPEVKRAARSSTDDPLFQPLLT